MSGPAPRDADEQLDLTRLGSAMLVPDRSDESWRGLELSSTSSPPDNTSTASLVDPALLGATRPREDAHSGDWASSLNLTPLRADERPQSVGSVAVPLESTRRVWPAGEEDVLEDVDHLTHSSAELTGEHTATAPQPRPWLDAPPLPPIPKVKAAHFPMPSPRRATFDEPEPTIASFGPGPYPYDAPLPRRNMSTHSFASELDWSGGGLDTAFGALENVVGGFDSEPNSDHVLFPTNLSRTSISVASDDDDDEEDATGPMTQELRGASVNVTRRVSSASETTSTASLIPASLIRTLPRRESSPLAEAPGPTPSPQRHRPSALSLEAIPQIPADGPYSRFSAIEEQEEPPTPSVLSSARSRIASAGVYLASFGGRKTPDTTPGSPDARSGQSSSSQSRRSSKASRSGRASSRSRSNRSSAATQRSTHFDARDAPPMPMASSTPSEHGTTPSARFRREVHRHEENMPLRALIARSQNVARLLGLGWLQHDPVTDVPPPPLSPSIESGWPDPSGRVHRPSIGTRQSTGERGSVWSRWSRPTSTAHSHRSAQRPTTIIVADAQRRRYSELDPVPRKRRSRSLNDASMRPTTPDHFIVAATPEKSHRQLHWAPSIDTVPRKRSRRRPIICALAILAIALALGVGLAVGLRNRGSSVGACACLNGGNGTVVSGQCSCSCIGAFVGTFCQLDSTCVCADPSVRSCPANGTLARSVLAAATRASTLFDPPVDAGRLATSMARYSSATSCGAQAALLDVPNLPPASQPRRSAWAEAALVWDMALSEQFDDALRSGIAKLGQLPSLADTPASALSSVFQVSAHGYTFDLSAMAIIEPARRWTIASTQQSRLVDSASQAVLDRMATRAGAAATQRTLALSHYWSDILGLPDARRTDFLAAIASTPIVVPVDAFAAGVAAQLTAATGSSSASFPSPPSCAGGATSAYAAVESGVFGLDGSSACAGRPIYGFVNVLGLRAPFLDNDPRRANLPGQAIVLASAVSARAVLHAGETVLLGATSSSGSSSPVSQRRYGTTTALDSVVLDWLQLMPVDVAKQVVALVLGQSPSRPIPPALNSTLALATNGLLDIPILEAAIFGSLPFSSSVGSTLSRIGPAASPGNSSMSIFGTPAADAWRRWALQTPPRRTRTNALGWTQGALDPVVSREVSVGATDDFEPIWRSGTGRSVQSVCDRLEAAGLVSP